MTSGLLRFLILALLFVAAFAIAVLTPIGQRLDATSLGSFPAIRDGIWAELYSLRTGGLIVLCLVATGSVIHACFRRRLILAVRASALMLVTAAVAHLSDLMLVRPNLGAAGYLYNTYPSGHSAIALAAIVAIAWTWPTRGRTAVVFVLAGCAFAVGVFSWLSFAHRSSDVVGGALLVGSIAALLSLPSSGAVRATAEVQQGKPSRTFYITANFLLLVACACLIFAAISADAPAAALVGVATVVGYGTVIVVVLEHALRWRRAADGWADSRHISMKK